MAASTPTAPPQTAAQTIQPGGPLAPGDEPGRIAGRLPEHLDAARG
jgi:hypothetical protein